MDLEVGDIVLCTVDRIVGTNVFVKIHAGTKEIEGCIVTSEIAPGRIRNIRDYVVPKKKIVCKILRISGDRIDLSLRRVTQKEQKEIKEQDNQEKSYESILKSVLGEKSGEIMEKIQKRDSIYNFLQNAKENAKELESLVGRENTKKIMHKIFKVAGIFILGLIGCAIIAGSVIVIKRILIEKVRKNIKMNI